MPGMKPLDEKSEAPKRWPLWFWPIFAVCFVGLLGFFGLWSLGLMYVTDRTAAVTEFRFMAACAATIVLGGGYLVMRLRRKDGK